MACWELVQRKEAAREKEALAVSTTHAPLNNTAEPHASYPRSFWVAYITQRKFYVTSHRLHMSVTTVQSTYSVLLSFRARAAPPVPAIPPPSSGTAPDMPPAAAASAAALPESYC